MWFQYTNLIFVEQTFFLLFRLIVKCFLERYNIHIRFSLLFVFFSSNQSQVFRHSTSRLVAVSASIPSSMWILYELGRPLLFLLHVKYHPLDDIVVVVKTVQFGIITTPLSSLLTHWVRLSTYMPFKRSWNEFIIEA